MRLAQDLFKTLTEKDKKSAAGNSIRDPGIDKYPRSLSGGTKLITQGSRVTKQVPLEFTSNLS